MNLIQTKTLVAFLVVLTLIAVAPRSDFAQRLSERNLPATNPKKDDRKAIEEIVRQYILSNPQVVQEALDALKKIEAEKQRAEVIRKLRSVSTELFDDKDAPFVGNENSSVPIVVFFDYNCGYCKSTLPALDSLIEEDPKAKVIFKEFPILGAGSTLAAKAALAAAEQGKYKEFHKQLLYASEIDLEVIKKISESLKLDTAVLLAAIESPKLDEMIKRNYSLAEKLGINGTPVYVVGERLIPGAIDAGSLTRILEQERSKQKK